MRLRLRRMLPDGSEYPWAGTFHSLAFQLLRSYNTIADYSLLKDGEEEELKMSIASLYQNKLLYIPYDLLANIRKQSGLPLFVKNIYEDFSQKFHETKRTRKQIGFDDFLPLLLKEWQENESYRKDFSNRFDAILVDEFQDTNPEQIEFLQKFLMRSHDFLAVGDDWQAIYGFRNADMTVLTRFEKFFPNSKTFFLTMNYRSTPQIIQTANRVLALNREKVKKKMKSVLPAGSEVHFYFFENRNELQKWISDAWVMGTKISKEKKTILCRTNVQCNFFLPAESETVSAMTIHQAKGLEFDHVLVAALEDHVFPHRDADIEEERRLLFVALSRAKKKLEIGIIKSHLSVEKQFSRELGYGIVNPFAYSEFAES